MLSAASSDALQGRLSAPRLLDWTPAPCVPLNDAVGRLVRPLGQLQVQRLPAERGNDEHAHPGLRYTVIGSIHNVVSQAVTECFEGHAPGGHEHPGSPLGNALTDDDRRAQNLGGVHDSPGWLPTGVVMRPVLAACAGVTLAGWAGHEHVMCRHLSPVSFVQVLNQVLGARVILRVDGYSCGPVIGGPQDIEAGCGCAFAEAAHAGEQVDASAEVQFNASHGAPSIRVALPHHGHGSSPLGSVINTGQVSPQVVVWLPFASRAHWQGWTLPGGSRWCGR